MTRPAPAATVTTTTTTAAAPAGNGHPWLLVEATAARGSLAVRCSSSRGAPRAGEVAAEAWLEGRGAVEDRDGAAANAIAWDDAAVVVRTSVLNTTPVYVWTDRERRRLLVGTDTPTLIARAVELGGRDAGLAGQVHAIRSRVRRLGPHGRFRFAPGRDVPGRIELHEQDLGAAWPPARPDEDETAAAAGRRQLDALARTIAGDRDVSRPATVLVSGGVDSAAVAAVAARASAADELATICTAWGDEAAHAAELGAALDLPLTPVELSEAALVDAVPDTVRLLGLPSRDLVLVAVTLTAAYRSGTLRPGTLLTGYASDIINSGLRTEPGLVADVRGAVRRQVDYATRSGELSAVAGLAHGYRVRHPFWSPAVVRAALATAPGLLSHGGREKGHLRAAVGELLPSDIAWRRKRAMHDGTGVLFELEAAITRRSGLPAERLQDVYDATLPVLVERLLADPEATADGRACLDAAAELVRRQAAS
jgi:asparagine synthetase B (glutamine-hydrolysing)